MRCKPHYALIALAVFLCSVGVPHPRPAQAAPPAPPPGFYLEVTPTKNARYAALGDAFVKDGRMRSILALYTDQIVMQRVIPVRLRECGAANAYYVPQSHEIWLCYELLDGIYRAWEEVLAGDPAAGKPDIRPLIGSALLVARTVSTTLFIAMHEMGHCLIHEFSWGYSGKEEDAVDDFATIAVLSVQQERIGVDGAVSMALFTPLAKLRAAGIDVFWDAHAFGEQRYADILCTLYGSDPAGHAGWVPQTIPAARAARCPQTFAAKRKFWTEKFAGIIRKE